MYEFEYAAPTTVAEAVRLLGEADARPLAGGTDLIAQMKEGRRKPRRIVDLKRIPELTAVTTANGHVRIGAAASISAVAANSVVRERYPAVVEASQLIGSFQIQNRASIGGNVCNAAPSADAVPALLVSGARGLIVGPNGEREIDLPALFKGPGQTTLGPGELLAAVLLPPVAERSAAKYLRFIPRAEMDIAVAGAGAWIRLDANGTIAEARLALASVAPTPIRAPEAEAALVGQKPATNLLTEAGRLAARAARPISDTRGSKEYRIELVKVLTERALQGCLEQLGITA
ncbi:MAG: xanthine dehydrogenase family protein subunit M [Chloroflexi bacterium]|nr:xanthine dehydrogenase family protein subunit M [Chloroflexota bacterium]